MVAHRTPAPVLASSLLDLAPRDREALAHLIAGRSQKESATAMGISERMVGWHLRRARDRIGVRSNIQAVLWALPFVAVRDFVARERFASRFAPIPPHRRGHRLGCFCSVCFIRTHPR